MLSLTGGTWQISAMFVLQFINLCCVLNQGSRLNIFNRSKLPSVGADILPNLWTKYLSSMLFNYTRRNNTPIFHEIGTMQNQKIPAVVKTQHHQCRAVIEIKPRLCNDHKRWIDTFILETIFQSEDTGHKNDVMEKCRTSEQKYRHEMTEQKYKPLFLNFASIVMLKVS